MKWATNQEVHGNCNGDQQCEYDTRPCTVREKSHWSRNTRGGYIVQIPSTLRIAIKIHSCGRFGFSLANLSVRLYRQSTKCVCRIDRYMQRYEPPWIFIGWHIVVLVGDCDAGLPCRWYDTMLLVRSEVERGRYCTSVLWRFCVRLACGIVNIEAVGGQSHRWHTAQSIYWDPLKYVRWTEGWTASLISWILGCLYSTYIHTYTLNERPTSGQRHARPRVVIGMVRDLRPRISISLIGWHLLPPFFLFPRIARVE